MLTVCDLAMACNCVVPFQLGVLLRSDVLFVAVLPQQRAPAGLCAARLCPDRWLNRSLLQPEVDAGER